MREILFRGKDYLCNWHYGSLIQEEYLEPNWEDLENPKTQNNYAIRYKNENDWVSGYKNIEVMPRTIGQYTGLTDKNGKKIFQGDIVKSHRKYDGDKLYEVCFGRHTIECCGCCYESHETIGFYLGGYNDDEETWDNLEVVGNIWDNGDLLNEN